MLTIEMTNELFFTEKMILAIKDRWCGMECYLDGKRAIISGRRLNHAIVVTFDGSQSIQFSWPTVNRIMYGKMEFYS